MQEPKQLQLKAIFKGIATALANNILPEGVWLYAQNILITEEGVIQARPKLGTLASTKADALIHSIKRINSGNSSLRIAGATDKLYAETAVGLLNEIEDGFSSNPLTLLDFRTELAVSPHCFVGDTSKMCKVDINGNVQNIGIGAPISALTWKISPPLRKILDQLGATTSALWAASGGAAITTPSKVNTTVTAILYDDTGLNTGLCSVIPALSDNIHDGVILRINSAEDIIAENTYPAVVPTGTTIAAITYDSGTTGACTITPSLSSPNIKKDMVVRLNGSEYVRITEVLPSNEGQFSFKCSTIGSFSAGQSIDGVFSFRSNTDATYAAGHTLVTDALKIAIAGAGTTTVSRSITADLSSISTRTLTEDDFVFVAMKFSVLSTLTEVQVQFDIDRTTNDFTRNYYWYAIRPNDLLQAQLQQQSYLSVQQYIAQVQQLQAYLRQTQRSYDQIDAPINFDVIIPIEPINPPDQTALGVNQWSIFKIRLGDLIANRVGTDTSQSFRDVKAIRFSAKTTGAVDIEFDSLWLGGGYQLDGAREGFLPLNYVYRYGNTNTKERSSWSPPLRTWITEKQNRLELTPEVSTDTQVDIIEIARIGSSLTEFHIIGSKPNDADPFLDDISDVTAQQGRKAIFDSYQLFVKRLAPMVGRCDVNGTILTITTTPYVAFNENMLRGTTIIVNGIVNSTYTKPTRNGGVVELENSMGSLTDVEFHIPEPVVEGQPLLLMNGIVGEGSSGLYIFGIDDTTLYWSDGNTASSMSESNFLEITNPSEKLLNGAFWDGSLYLWTNERGFQVLSGTSSTGKKTWFAKPNAGTRGLLSRFAICSSKHGIFYLSDDGIYQIYGSGESRCITDSVQNLFPIKGKTPSPLTLSSSITVHPPDYTEESELRLFEAGGLLFFKYLNTNNERICLVLDILNGRVLGIWTFSDDLGAVYAEEAANIYDITYGIGGNLMYTNSSATDDDAIQAILLTGALDMGAMTALKRMESVIIDSIPVDLDVSALFDYHTTEETLTTLTGTTRLQQSVSLNGTESRSVGIKLMWELVSNTKLYEMLFLIHIIGNITNVTITPFDDAGLLRDKLWQGIIIKGSTFGQNKTLNFYADDDTDTIVATLTINHTETEQIRSYSFPVPFIAHAVQFRTDDVEWLPIQWEYKFDVEPELADVWEGEYNAHGLQGYKTIPYASICYNSTTNITLTLTLDDGTSVTRTFPATGGALRRNTLFLPTNKSRLFKWRIESTSQFRLYRNLSEVIIFSLSSQQQVIVPFGDDTAQTEIRI